VALDQIRSLFHFTDTRNLTSIRERGGLYSWQRLQEMGVVVDVPGGNDWSHDADALKGLDTYVHLCLRANHPMEYIARCREGRIERSLFLEIDRSVLDFDGVLFTEDVSNKRGVETRTLDEAEELIDFDVIDGNIDYQDQDHLARLRQVEKCEILVPDFIPIELIRNLRNG
jgi:hypothetical protein